MQPHRCKEVAAAGPGWPATLTLVGALVSSRKVAKSSSWTHPTSLAMAAKLLQLQVHHGVQICTSWMDKVSTAAAAATPSQLSSSSSITSACAGLQGAASSTSISVSGCGSRERGRDLPPQQHQQQQLGRKEGGYVLSEQRHLLDSLKWALLSCMLGATDTVSELASLAVLAARHSEHWQEVAWDTTVTAAAAGGAERVDGEIYKKYYELLGEAAGKYRVPRLGIPEVARLTAWTTGIGCVGKLLHSFGSLRVFKWAGGAQQGFWKKLCPDDDAAFSRISSIICSIGDDDLPGGKGSSMMESLPSSVRGLAPVVLPMKLCSSLIDHEAQELQVMACHKGFTMLERKMAAIIQAVAYPGQEGKDEDAREGEAMMPALVHRVAISAARGLSGCYARGCCNNARCRNLSGVSEMGLVVGTKGAKKVCGGCRLACYCSLRCQREAWTMHRIFCAKYVQDTEGEAS